MKMTPSFMDGTSHQTLSWEFYFFHTLYIVFNFFKNSTFLSTASYIVHFLLLSPRTVHFLQLLLCFFPTPTWLRTASNEFFIFVQSHSNEFFSFVKSHSYFLYENFHLYPNPTHFRHNISFNTNAITSSFILFLF